MRLEDDMHFSESALRGCGQSGADLRRMMAIIVNHAHARDFALQLESAIDSPEMLQCMTDLLRRDVQSSADSNSRGGIQHVMHPRNKQGEFAQRSSRIINCESIDRPACFPLL